MVTALRWSWIQTITDDQRRRERRMQVRFFAGCDNYEISLRQASFVRYEQAIIGLSRPALRLSLRTTHVHYVAHGLNADTATPVVTIPPFHHFTTPSRLPTAERPCLVPTVVLASFRTP